MNSVNISENDTTVRLTPVRKKEDENKNEWDQIDSETLEVFKHLKVGDQVAEDILVDRIGLESSNGIIVTSHLKRQVHYITESLAELSTTWSGTPGHNKFRFLQGVSGMGKSISLKVCAKYVQCTSTFLLYIDDPMIIVNSVAELNYKRVVKNIESYNFENVWQKYLSNDNNENDLYKIVTGKQVKETYGSYEAFAEEIFNRLHKRKKPIVIILDDYQKLVEELEKTEIMQNRWVSMVSKQSEFNTLPLVVLVAASQHHGYDVTIDRKTKSSVVHYAAIPNNPMDIHGALLRMVAIACGCIERSTITTSDDFKNKLKNARLALSFSGLLLNPAIKAIKEVYLNTSGWVPEADHELIIRNSIIQTMEGKLNAHLAVQNKREDKSERPANSRKLINQYLKAFKDGVAQLQSRTEFKRFRDLGIMTYHNGSYRYISELAKLLHLRQLLCTTAVKSKDDEDDTLLPPPAFDIRENEHAIFEAEITRGVVTKGLPEKMRLGIPGAIPVVPHVGPADYLLSLNHNGHPSQGPFQLSMESRQVAFLRNLLKGKQKSAVIAILVAGLFPAFDMLLLKKDANTARATIFGVQISIAKEVSRNRFEHSGRVLFELLKLLSIDDTVLADSPSLTTPNYEEEKKLTWTEMERMMRTPRKIIARIKCGSVTRNTDVVSIQFWNTYLGLAEHSDDRPITTQVNGCTAVFYIGKKEIEETFKVRILTEESKAQRNLSFLKSGNHESMNK